MKIIDLDIVKNINFNKNYIALGNFDGLHIAHMHIINNLIKDSRENKAESSILLFKSHTLVSLENTNKNHMILTSLEDKIEILKTTNIDNVFLIDFNNIKNIDADLFVKEFLIDKLNVRGVYVGYDYKFGFKGLGDVDLLLNNFENLLVKIQEPINYDQVVVSSSYIKSLIFKNKLLEAEKLLGRKYYLKGNVIRGKQLGTKLGFPTANIELNNNYVLPTEGVYITEIVYKNKRYKAATSLGKNYTFNENEIKIEAHILNFKDIIYSNPISIRFIKKIRPMEKFENIDLLIEQVFRDINYINKKDIGFSEI